MSAFDVSKMKAAVADKWWHTGLRTIACHSSSSEHLFLFIFAFQEMCATKKSRSDGRGESVGKAARSANWKLLDNNGNKIVSLAETGKFIKDHLMNFYSDKKNVGGQAFKPDGEALYKHFYPCFIRAFLDAADYGPASKVKGITNRYATKTADGDDYLQFEEFRLLLNYLCIYATIYEAFANIDGGGKGVDATDDRRITLEEWQKNRALLEGHPLLSLSISAKGGDDIFHKMDGDGKGKVLLAEFSTYVEDHEYYLNSDWGKLLNAGEPVNPIKK